MLYLNSLSKYFRRFSVNEPVQRRWKNYLDTVFFPLLATGRLFATCWWQLNILPLDTFEQERLNNKVGLPTPSRNAISPSRVVKNYVSKYHFRLFFPKAFSENRTKYLVSVSRYSVVSNTAYQDLHIRRILTSSM